MVLFVLVLCLPWESIFIRKIHNASSKMIKKCLLLYIYYVIRFGIATNMEETVLRCAQACKCVWCGGGAFIIC